YTYFPRLAERRQAKTGYISGGEQQMGVIGRALMARPKLILLDEPSMGLAPQLVVEIFDIVRLLHEEESVSFLLAEQNTTGLCGLTTMDTSWRMGGSCLTAALRLCARMRTSKSFI